jgi:recombination protein RecA
MATAAQQDDRKKALNLAIAQIEKSCGKGSIMKMGADRRAFALMHPDGRDQSRCGDRYRWNSSRSCH